MKNAPTTASLKTIEGLRDEKLIEKLLIKKGIFPVHLAARLSDYNRLPAERPAFIFGPVGSGKTHLSVAYMVDIITQDLAKHPEREAAAVGFIRAVDLILMLRSSFREWGPGELIERFSRYPFLVIDDLGTERDTPLVQEALYSILDYRAGHRAPSLINSNLSLDHIAGQYGEYGERIASRIAGMGPSLELKGKDHRWQR